MSKDRKDSEETPPSPREHAENAPSRAWLKAQAVTWRFLMGIGMVLHRLPSPYPVKPAFQRIMTIKEPFLPGTVQLQFFTPDGYKNRPKDKKYPIMLNFHGGGFTIGSATDDARWFSVAMEQLDCVVCSVDYRLAPEHPFPTGMQDGVAAMHWLQKHAGELGLDIDRVITSGFSAGGNFCFTSPMLYAAEHRRKRQSIVPGMPMSLQPEEEATGIRNTGRLRVIACTAFYPAVDFTQGRPHRRSMNPSPAHELPYYLTDLFDASYLYPPDKLDMADPFLSPAVAKEEFLHMLPQDILIHTCEFDGLADEGRRFAERLDAIGKRVFYREIKGVPHGFDRHPALKIPPAVKSCYMEVCSVIKGLLKDPNLAVQLEPIPGTPIGVPSTPAAVDVVKNLDSVPESAAIPSAVPRDHDVADEVNVKKNPDVIAPSDQAEGKTRVDKSVS